jgi:hypothetical protein
VPFLLAEQPSAIMAGHPARIAVGGTVTCGGLNSARGET